MDTDEEITEIDVEETNAISHIKDNIAVISSNEDLLYVLTNIFELMPDINDPLINPIQNERLKDSSEAVFDTSKETQNLDINDIMILTVKKLNSQIDISKEDIKILSNDYQSDSKEYISQLIPENVSYGLKVRSKGEKLSHDQRIFLKELSNNYNIPTIEIWNTFKFSPTVLYRIKITAE